MKNFTDIVNRLKTALSVTMDKEVAEFLGMTKSAFAERKRRNVFPEEALRLADLRYSDLKLDLEYILTGNHKTEQLQEFFQAESEKIIAEKLERFRNGEEEEISPVRIGTFYTPRDADIDFLINSEEFCLLDWYRSTDTEGKKLIFNTAKMAHELARVHRILNRYMEREDLDDTEPLKPNNKITK